MMPERPGTGRVELRSGPHATQAHPACLFRPVFPSRAGTGTQRLYLDLGRPELEPMEAQIRERSGQPGGASWYTAERSITCIA